MLEPIDLELVTTESALQRLGPEWNDLVAASQMDTPFLQWEWCATWWRHYGDGHKLAVVLARDRGRLIGLAPLFVERDGSGASHGVIKFLGTGDVCSEYLSFVLRSGYEEPATREILDFVLHGLPLSWRQLRLTNVPESGPATANLRSHLAAAKQPFRVERGATAWRTNLAPSWDEFLAKLSRNRREKLRRARRDLEKHGLEFREIKREQDLDAAWQDLVRLHQARWEQLGEPGCFASPRFARFHADLLRPLWRRGMITLASLWRGERAVAVSYCLRHRGHVYFYQSGVDPEWMHCRPGHCLRACELRRAIERGDRVFDFLSGDEEYKAQWATEQAAMHDFIVAGPGLLPRVRFGLESASRWAKESARSRLSADTWATLRRWRKHLTDGPAPGSPPSPRQRAETAEEELPV